MKRECIIIKVRRKEGLDQFKDVIVYGWPTGLPGLSVTLDYCAATEGFKRYGYTHTRSGISFHAGILGCKRDAIRHARKYFRGIDWTLDKDHIVNQPGAVEAYKRSVSNLVFK